MIRKALFGAAIFGAYRYVRSLVSGPAHRTHDGLSAVFSTREQADLAVERLVQEHRVDRTFIYVEPLGDRNSAGTQISGGDHASGEAGSQDRSDGSLHGAIQVTVPLGQDNKAILTNALREAGAKQVEAF
jgi:hypothetical protein